MNKFELLSIGDRVKTKQSGMATVVEIGCFGNTMVKLRCDRRRWSCPYFYEYELELDEA